MSEMTYERDRSISPDVPILVAAAASLLFSVYLWFGVDEGYGLYAATWVPSILAFGCFMKIPRRPTS